MITGFCWAVRTTNVHQYKVAEKNMETYIWLYQNASSKMKGAYRRIVENYNITSMDFLFSAKLFSYMTLYLLFSVLCLFTAQIFLLIFYQLAKYYCLSQCLYVWWGVAVGLAVLSGFFFICACLTLYVRLRRDSDKESEFIECFNKCSTRFANITLILKEDWIEFYRKKLEDQPPLGCYTGYQQELRDIMQKYSWFRYLPKIYIDC
jgi:hypothetical protein